MLKVDVNNNIHKYQPIILIGLYISLLIGFILGENSTGGAIIDYNNQKWISKRFAESFLSTLLSFDNYNTRHSPVLIFLLSFFEKFDLNDKIIRIIHLHFCLFLPFIFFKCLKINFKSIDKNILLFFVSLIFLSPTFRSLSIWPDSRIFGLIFFSLSVFYFLKFKEEKKFIFVIKNIFFLSLSSYFSPNFSVFSIFYFIFYIENYKIFSKQILFIIFINLLLAIPAIYYIFFLDINFLIKSAAIGRQSDNIIFDNIFNDILISFSIIFFYIFPFFVTKIIKPANIFDIKNFIISILIFFICILNFDYNYEYSGGGIFLKFSNIFFKNNFIFYIISFFSIIILLPFFTKNKYNLLMFVLIILNNPQYTIYHKYFDPFLLIVFFTIFVFRYDFMQFFLKKINYIFIYFYFSLFLLISNFKYLWIN